MADLSGIADPSSRGAVLPGSAPSRLVLGGLALAWAAAAAVCLVGPSRQLVLGVTSASAAVLLGFAAVRRRAREPAPVPDVDPVSGMVLVPRTQGVAQEPAAGGASFGILLVATVLSGVVVVLSGWHVARELQVRRDGVPGTAAVASVPRFPWGDPVCVYVYGLTRPRPPLCGRLVGASALTPGDTVVIHTDREDPTFVVVDTGLPTGVDVLVVSLAMALSLGALCSRRARRRRIALTVP